MQGVSLSPWQGRPRRPQPGAQAPAFQKLLWDHWFAFTQSPWLLGLEMLRPEPSGARSTVPWPGRHPRAS